MACKTLTSISPNEELRSLPKERRTVYVHVTFLKLGEINTLKEQFDADILLRAQWREPKLDLDDSEKPVVPSVPDLDSDEYWHPKIYIDNVYGEPRRTSSLALKFTEKGEAIIVERRRVKGTFVEALELWEFPFDVQDLSITVVSDLPSDEVELVDDPNEIHKIYKQSFIDEQEWYLYKYVESETKDMARDKADPTVRRSALTATCRAGRRPAYFIWNIFTVTFLITFLSFVTFAVRSEKVENRLQLTFTLVLTAVAFKFVVNQSLPKISYLTYLDRYIMAAMCTLVAICIWHGIQGLIMRRVINAPKQYYELTVYHEATTDDVTTDPGTVHRISEYTGTSDFYGLAAFAGLYTFYNIQFVLRIIMKPYRKRRQMNKLESQYIKTVADHGPSVKKTVRDQSKKKTDSTDDDSEVDDYTPMKV